MSRLAIPDAGDLLTSLLQQDASPDCWPRLLEARARSNDWLKEHIPALETFMQSLPTSLEAFPREDGEWVARATRVITAVRGEV